MVGLSRTSDVQVLYEEKDKEKIIRYRVAIDILKVADLEAEIESLEALLDLSEPTMEELITQGRDVDPYYNTDKDSVQRRIDEIRDILGQVRWL